MCLTELQTALPSWLKTIDSRSHNLFIFMSCYIFHIKADIMHAFLWIVTLTYISKVHLHKNDTSFWSNLVKFGHMGSRNVWEISWHHRVDLDVIFHSFTLFEWPAVLHTVLVEVWWRLVNRSSPRYSMFSCNEKQWKWKSQNNYNCIFLSRCISYVYDKRRANRWNRLWPHFRPIDLLTSGLFYRQTVGVRASLKMTNPATIYDRHTSSYSYIISRQSMKEIINIILY